MAIKQLVNAELSNNLFIHYKNSQIYNCTSIHSTHTEMHTMYKYNADTLGLTVYHLGNNCIIITSSVNHVTTHSEGLEKSSSEL